MTSFQQHNRTAAVAEHPLPGGARRLPRPEALAAGLSIARGAHAAGSDVLRIGFVGCGNRGTGACREALSVKPEVKLVAMGDLFPERLQKSLANLQKYEELNRRIDVPEERQFTGFDAYQRVLEAGVDMVLLSTPPHFRPLHYAAAVAAGKHAFLEKPCCVDAPGYRTLVAANEVARQKKLSVVVGLQRRHQRNYAEGIAKIRAGAVGEIRFLRVYFNMEGGGRAGELKPAGMSEMEYQIRHWGVFCWLCGDHIVEQATHEIDVANWIVDAHPIRANGMGGRQVRKGPGNGDIWDHHAVEFEYPGGVRLFCQARQQAGTWSHVSDNVHGTAGKLTLGTGPWGLGNLTPRHLRARDFHDINPYQREHDDLVASILGTGPQPGSRIRRHQQHDGRDGPHGHLLRPGAHLGRGHEVRVASGPGTLRPGRQAPDRPRRHRQLYGRDPGRDEDVLARANTAGRLGMAYGSVGLIPRGPSQPGMSASVSPSVRLPRTSIECPQNKPPSLCQNSNSPRREIEIDSRLIRPVNCSTVTGGSPSSSQKSFLSGSSFSTANCSTSFFQCGSFDQSTSAVLSASPIDLASSVWKCTATCLPFQFAWPSNQPILRSSTRSPNAAVETTTGARSSLPIARSSSSGSPSGSDFSKTARVPSVESKTLMR